MTEQFVPPLARTLPALVLEAAQRHAGRVFVEDGDIVVDYADLPARAFEVSRALIAHGIAAGDRIAIWAPNRAEWLLAALGIHCAGAVMVPINSKATAAYNMPSGWASELPPRGSRRCAA